MMELLLHFGGCLMLDTAYVLSLGEGFSNLADNEWDKFIVARLMADNT